MLAPGPAYGCAGAYVTDPATRSDRLRTSGKIEQTPDGIPDQNLQHLL